MGLVKDQMEFNFIYISLFYLNSVQFSLSVTSNSLRPHELQHTRSLCPSPTPGIHPKPCPSHPLLSPSPPVVLEKTLESPLDCNEIKPFNPKGNQSWVFTGRTDAEAETTIHQPPDSKN